LERKIVSMLLSLCVVWPVAAGAEKGKGPLQHNIESGVYIHNDLVKLENIKKLPIPITNEDYAFYQSIGNVSNIVIGKFKAGHRMIILVSDRNADGAVDYACKWFVDQDRMEILPNPSSIYSNAQFEQMKDDIVNGKTSALVSPNPEGKKYMEMLRKTSSNVARMKNGFRISGMDPDASNVERVNYFFSDNNTLGVDLAFEVKYTNMGLSRIKPLISIFVYCKGSYDPYAIKAVKALIKETGAFYFDR
jgi:hypothetical protein